MHPVLVIAQFTIDYLLHHRIRELAAAVFLACFFGGHYMGNLLIGSYLKILLDCALFSFQLFTFLVITFYSIPYFQQQAECQTYAFFLTKPLSRTQFFLGSLLGFFILLLSFCLLFYAASVLTLYYLTGKWFLQLYPAYLSIAAEGSVLISIAVFFSLLLSHPLSYLATFATYTICYTNAQWYQMIQKKSEGLCYFFGTLVYYLLPDLSIVDIKSSILYQLPINWPLFVTTLLYSFCFCALFLFGGQQLFIKKYLK